MTIYFSAFFREYFAIGNNDQRLQYKQDFNTEYEEYRQLHETIDSVAKKFLNLELLRKETRRDSLEFEVTDRNSLYIIKFFRVRWIVVPSASLFNSTQNPCIFTLSSTIVSSFPKT